MGLNIGGSGIIKPYVKYNAKADKWFVRGEDGNDAEIARPTFVIDLDNIATGWLRFREGQAPERVMDASLEQPAPSPGEGFKRGFVVATYSPKFFGGVVEFASASIHLSNAVKDIYAQYEVEKSKHASQLPVVACTGSQPMKDKYGTNYKPALQIIQWVDRPADLPNESPVEASDVWRRQQGGPAAKPTAQHVAPPAKPAANPLSEAVF